MNDDTHPLLPDVATLLAPDRLAALTRRRVDAAHEEALGPQESAYSGSHITAVRLSPGGERLLLKRVSRRWDYFMRVTDDRTGREARVFADGLLDRLPPELAHPYLAVARDGDGFAILMRDVAAALLSRRPPLDAAGHDRLLDALAAFHAAFWDDPDAASAARGYCVPRDHYHVISPAAAARDPDQTGVMPAIVADGWERLAMLLDPGIARELLALTNDPAPLVTALAPLPQTVVHGDFRAANLGLEPGSAGRAVAIDWALVGRGVAALDAVWYAASLGGLYTAAGFSREDALARYRAHLARRLGAGFDGGWWEPMRELSLLGGCIRYAWIAARATAALTEDRRAAAHVDLAWWQQAARRGLARL